MTAAAVVVMSVAAGVLLYLAPHISRYRAYVRRWPGARQHYGRGHVWKHTR